MNITDAFRWLSDPSRLRGPNGIVHRVVQHLGISGTVLLIAAAIAVPAGLAVGHTGRGTKVVVAIAGGVRSLPTLGLITLIALNVGIGLRAPVCALVVLAIPSILAGAYAGVQSIDRRTVDAARAIGTTEWQILTKVELPLGRTLLVGGLRSASLQVIATATLADYVGGGGLGRFIFLGLKTNDYPQMLAGSILVIGLAIASEAAFTAAQRITRVRGVTAETSHAPARP